MDKNQMRIERLRILKKIDGLNVRSQAGEDVDKELLSCGQQLDKLAKKTRRKNVLNADYFGELELVERKPTNEITKELIERAAANGISYSALKSRVRNFHWDMERAVTEKPVVHIKADFKGLTVAKYKSMKAKGMLDAEIIKKLGLTVNAMNKFKKKYKLVGISVKGVAK